MSLCVGAAGCIGILALITIIVVKENTEFGHPESVQRVFEEQCGHVPGVRVWDISHAPHGQPTKQSALGLCVCVWVRLK